MKKNIGILLIISFFVILSTVVCSIFDPQEQIGEFQPARTSAASTKTLRPTFTPQPTSTALPTQTQIPVSSPTPEPSPTPQFENIPRTHPETLPEISIDLPAAGSNEENRPEFSGPAYYIGTTHFRIYYTLEGDDAISSKDDDNNQIPDYAEETARLMEYVWDTAVNYFGWTAPPPDEGAGGDDRYDVYLLNIITNEEAFGYTEGGYSYTDIGDNPNSEVIETRAHSSFLVLDNDYAESQDEDYYYGYTALQSLHSTAAHEFMHAIQFGYDGEEPMEWLWEASANWFQDELFNNINDANVDLTAVFKSPDSCQLAYGGEDRLEDEYHWYGLWIFIRYISEQYGHQAVQQIWDNAVLLNGYHTIETTLLNQATQLNDVFIKFSIALLTRGFEEGGDYPTVRLEGEAKADELFIPQDGVGQMGADYIKAASSGTTTFRLNSDEELSLIGAGYSEGQVDVFESLNQEIAVDPSVYEHFYLAVINLGQARNEIECRFYPYTVNLISGGDPSTPAWSIDAPNFIEPDVEELLISPIEDSPEIEIADHLVPPFIPEDYYLSGSFEITRADVPQGEEDWWIPGDAGGWQLDYDHQNGDYFSIVISESPFDTLDDFLIFMDFQPLDEETFFINNKSILLFDYSEENSPYFDATFIHSGNFYVVFGEMEFSLFEAVIQGILEQ